MYAEQFNEETTHLFLKKFKNSSNYSVFFLSKLREEIPGIRREMSTHSILNMDEIFDVIKEKKLIIKKDESNVLNFATLIHNEHLKDNMDKLNISDYKNIVKYTLKIVLENYLKYMHSMNFYSDKIINMKSLDDYFILELSKLLNIKYKILNDNSSIIYNNILDLIKENPIKNERGFYFLSEDKFFINIKKNEKKEVKISKLKVENIDILKFIE